MRRAILQDLKENYPEIDDISYDELMKCNIIELCAMIESRKLEVRMFIAAAKIQR